MSTVELNRHLTASIPSDRPVETPNPPTYDAAASSMEAPTKRWQAARRDRQPAKRFPVRATQMDTSGGLNETEVNELTMPTGSPPMPPLPRTRPDSPLVLGRATVDHSGRLRDRVVLDALGWGPGDFTRTTVERSSLWLSRVTGGGVAIDARGRVFLPAGARALLDIPVDGRIVLIADPRQDLLIAHPVRVIVDLLAHQCIDHSEQ